MAEKIYTDYYSHLLGMSLPVEITGGSGYPLLMFPTSQGSFTQNSDFKLTDTIQCLVDERKIKIYNIQTIDNQSLYDKSIAPEERIRRYDLYMRFLSEEYIPYLQKEHSTHRIAAAGASFGAFHTANVAFRFPDLVSHAVCLSGAYSCRSFMDGFSNDLVYYNSPAEFMRNEQAWRFGHMKIVLSTSDEDICLQPTREMAEILSSRGINFWYNEQKWIAHDWPLWRMVFPKFMGEFFGK